MNGMPQVVRRRIHRLESAEGGTMKTTMKELYKEERPYEKCLACGPGALSDTELLAVILRTGSSGENVCQLAGRILSLPDFEDCRGCAGFPWSA